jgi:FKBP-type peptidyl-prolyl cis-trans isomerase (trigger factor)
MGTTFDAYLAQVKKSREEVRKEWQETADKRAKTRLILAEIARKENIEPSAEVVDHEMEHATQHYPSADKGALRAHISHALRNEMVLRSLTGESMDLSHKHE